MTHGISFVAWSKSLDWKEKYVEMLFPFHASKARIEVAYFLKYQNLPKYLYKYREVNERAKNNLRKGTVWLADPDSLNDPYDCAHAIDPLKLSRSLSSPVPAKNLDQLPEPLLSMFARTRASNLDPIEALLTSALEAIPSEKREAFARVIQDVQTEGLEKLARESNAAFKSAFKLCSFSERVDSTLMWSHYANYHKGFCIEYAIRAASPESYVSRFIYPVIYSDELFNLTEHFARSRDDHEFNNLYPNRIALQKAADWAYEREWRLLISNGLLDKPQPYPMPKPKHVYLGSKMSPTEEDEMVGICNGLGIPVSRMRLSSSTYKMEAVPLKHSPETTENERHRQHPVGRSR